MSFYTDMQSVASKILKDFRQGNLYVVKVTDGTGTPDNPGEPTLTTFSVDGTVSGISQKFVEMGFSTETDLEVILAVTALVTPSMNDFVRIDGVDYKIIKDMSVPASSTRVVWKFIVRKGG